MQYKENVQFPQRFRNSRFHSVQSNTYTAFERQHEGNKLHRFCRANDSIGRRIDRQSESWYITGPPSFLEHISSKRNIIFSQGCVASGRDDGREQSIVS